MTFFDLNELTLLLAQAAAPEDKPPAPFLLTLLPWVFLFGLIYFLFFRPISKARKDQENMAATVKTGAKVVTVGGIVGIVTNVKEKTVMIRSGSGEGSKLEILKEKLASVESKDSKDAKDEKSKDSSANKDSEDASDEAEEVDVEVTEDEAPASNSGNPYNRSRRRRKGARR